MVNQSEQQAPANDTPPTRPPASSNDAQQLGFEGELRKLHPRVFEESTETPAQKAAAIEAREKEAARQVAAGRQDTLDEFLRQVGRRYADCRLENYNIQNPGQQEVVDQVLAYASNMPVEAKAGNGLVLYGPSGTGKDHLLTGLARVATEQYGVSVTWANGLALFSELRDRIGADQPEREFRRRFTKPRILYLSDPAPPGGALTEYQQAMLFQILDSRYREAKPPWVTMNVAGGKEADDRLGAPLVDRLRDGALVLHCNWPSYRKAKEIQA